MGKDGKKREWRADAYALAALVALAWAPFVARMVVGKSALSLPLTHDVGFQWISFRAFIGQALADGVFPLWSSQVFAGFPFAAFSHTGVFYPPGWLFLLADYARVVNVFYPLHLCVAATGSYALCRRLGLSPLVAWLAALSYAFAGKPYYFIHFLPAACSNAWVPWFLFAATSLLRSGRVFYLALASATLALQVLGGDVESTSYGLLFSGPFLWIVSPREPGWRGRWFALGLAMAAGLLACAAQLVPLVEYSDHFVRNEGVTFAYFGQRSLSPSLILAAFLPLTGAGAGVAKVVDAPYFYLGVMALGLAAFASARRLGSGSGWLGLLALLTLAWSFGSIPLIDRVQYHLPLLNSFGSPEHAFFMGQLFVVALAGRGLEALLTGDELASAKVVGIVALVLAGLRLGVGFLGASLFASPWFLLALCGLAIGYALWWLESAKARLVVVAAVTAFQAIDLYGFAFIHLPANDPEIFERQPWLARTFDTLRPARSRHILVSRQGLSDPDLLYHAGLALDADAIDGWITVPPRNYAELLALADPRAAGFKDGKLDRLGLNNQLRDGRFISASSMPILDLLALRFVINRGLPLKYASPFYLFMIPPEGRGNASAPGAEVSNAGELTAPVDAAYRYRVFINDGDVLGLIPARAFHQEGASASCGVRYLIKSADATEQLYFDEVSSVVSTESPPDPESKRIPISLANYFGREVEIIVTTSGPRAGDDLYLKIPSPMIANRSKAFRQVMLPAEDRRDRSGAFTDVMVYENREAAPRAFVVYRARTIADDRALLARLGRADRSELTSTAFVSRDARAFLDSALPVGFDGSRSANVRFTSRRSGEERYGVESVRRGLLLISDQYYPGWRAYVGGREVPIFRADHCLRAVPVPAGKSELRLVFAPRSFGVGLWVSLVSVVFGVVVVGIGRGKEKRRI